MREEERERQNGKEGRVVDNVSTVYIYLRFELKEIALYKYKVIIT